MGQIFRRCRRPPRAPRRPPSARRLSPITRRMLSSIRRSGRARGSGDAERAAGAGSPGAARRRGLAPRHCPRPAQRSRPTVALELFVQMPRSSATKPPCARRSPAGSASRDRLQREVRANRFPPAGARPAARRGLLEVGRLRVGHVAGERAHVAPLDALREAVGRREAVKDHRRQRPACCGGAAKVSSRPRAYRSPPAAGPAPPSSSWASKARRWSRAGRGRGSSRARSRRSRGRAVRRRALDLLERELVEAGRLVRVPAHDRHDLVVVLGGRERVADRLRRSCPTVAIRRRPPPAPVQPARPRAARTRQGDSRCRSPLRPQAAGASASTLGKSWPSSATFAPPSARAERGAVEGRGPRGPAPRAAARPSPA